MEDSSTKKLSKHKSKIIIAIIVIAVFAVGFFVGRGNTKVLVVNEKGEPAKSGEVIINRSQVKEYLSKDVDFALFLTVWDMLRERYVDKDTLSSTKLFYSALEGLVAGLDDPYSVFLTPKVSDEFVESLNGRFEGIGAEIAIKHNVLTVVAPLPDSPALAAGLKAKDVILEIDGVSTADMRLDEAVNRIRGEKGTQVVLTVSRAGQDETMKISITRDTIKVASVTWEMKSGDIAYIELRNFNTDTTELFRKIQKEVIAQNPKGLIFDLRNNSGGFLQTAVDVSSAWVSGKLVVSERGINGQTKQYLSNGQALLAGIPTVVLINGGSASASEIVAGALQDYGVAYLIGETTFGKGSVQVLEDLSDGSSVKFTIARWYTPNDRSIDKEGIEPDEKVEFTEEDFSGDKDPQLERAVEYLSKK